MNRDDLTRPTTDESEDNKDTQPTITAVFMLLREVKQDVESIGPRLNAIGSRLAGIDNQLNAIGSRLAGIDNQLNAIDNQLNAIDNRLDAIDNRLNAIDNRLDAIDNRLNALELRLARDIEGVNTRVTEVFRELSLKIDVLNRGRLQTEAEYLGLLQRVTELESKAS